MKIYVVFKKEPCGWSADTSVSLIKAFNNEGDAEKLADTLNANNNDFGVEYDYDITNLKHD